MTAYPSQGRGAVHDGLTDETLAVKVSHDGAWPGGCSGRRAFGSGRLERQTDQLHEPRLDPRQIKPLEMITYRFSVISGYHIKWGIFNGACVQILGKLVRRRNHRMWLCGGCQLVAVSPWSNHSVRIGTWRTTVLKRP